MTRICQFAAFLMCLLPFSLTAQQVIKTIPAPDYPYGLAWDGSFLWVGTSSTNDNKIWKIDPADGSVAGSITVPFVPASGSYTVKALAYDGAALWVFMDLPSANHPDKFYRVDPASGAILKTINSPENNYVGGMTYFDNHIYYTQYFANATEGRDVIIKMDTTGTPVDTFVTVGEQPMGIDYNGQFFWCAEDTGFGATRQEIYEYDSQSGAFTGNGIGNPTASPRDMVFDGQYYWLVSYNNTNSLLYQFDITGGTPQIGVFVDELNFSLTGIGQTATRIISIANNGSAPLSITGLVFSQPVFGSTLTTFPSDIPAGGAINVEITFTPDAYGLRLGTLQILSSDPVNPTVSIDLRGTGLFNTPTVGLSASTHDFGSVWLPNEGVKSWRLGLINRGIQSLEIGSLELAASGFSVDSPALPFAILPDDTSEVTVWFAPTEVRVYRDTLLIGSNDPANPQTAVPLSGSGQSGPFETGYTYWRYQIPDNPATSFQEYRVEALKSIGDVTGDGLHDVIVASENYWTICLNGASSGEAAEVWRFSSYISQFSAGSIGTTNAVPHQQKALAITNDLNGDGYEDVVIGTGGGNEHVYALSGVSGEILWQFGTNAADSFSLGDITSVLADTDYNNDGIHDIVATASATSSGGLDGRRRVYCFDGPTGQLIWSYFVGAFLRVSANMGDLNGNGSGDLVVTTGEGIQNQDVVLALDSNGPGGLPTPIWTFAIGRTPGGGKELLRYNVPGETADVLVGAFFNQIYRLDGETGIPVWNASVSSAINQFALIRDLDGDNLNEVLVSSFDNNFYVLSGADGSVAWARFMGNFTWSAETIPDLNQDGIEDIVLACRNDILYVLSGSDGTPLLEYPMNSGELQGSTIAWTLPDMDNSNSFEILGAADGGQIVALSGGQLPSTGISAVPDFPNEFALEQNYPNPFNPSTRITFSLAQRSTVTLLITDILGREVALLFDNEPLNAGRHDIDFDATAFASGVYFYHLQGRDFSATRKMVLLR